MSVLQQMLIIILLSTVSRAQNCSDPWKEIQGACWGFFAFEDGAQNNDKSWNNAKLGCQRREAILGYPTVISFADDFEDIRLGVIASPEYDRWLFVYVGLYSTNNYTGPWVVLETGKEPNQTIPWLSEFYPAPVDNFLCGQLSIEGFEGNTGKIANVRCDESETKRIGYACKKKEMLDSTTTKAGQTNSTSDSSTAKMTGAMTGEITTADTEGTNTATLTGVVITGTALFVLWVVLGVLWMKQNKGTQKMGEQPSGTRRGSAESLEAKNSVRPSGAGTESEATLGSASSGSASQSPSPG